MRRIISLNSQKEFGKTFSTRIGQEIRASLNIQRNSKNLKRREQIELKNLKSKKQRKLKQMKRRFKNLNLPLQLRAFFKKRCRNFQDGQEHLLPRRTSVRWAHICKMGTYRSTVLVIKTKIQSICSSKLASSSRTLQNSSRFTLFCQRKMHDRGRYTPE